MVIPRGVDGATVRRARKVLARHRGGPWRVNRRAVSQRDLAEMVGRSRTSIARAEQHGGGRLLRLALVGALILEGVPPATIRTELPELVPELPTTPDPTRTP